MSTNLDPFNTGGSINTNPFAQPPKLPSRYAGVLANSLSEISLKNEKIIFIKPEVEIVKPDSDVQQFKEDDTAEMTQALCAINNIPQNRTEPVKVYNRIDVALKKQSFYGDKVLDSSVRPDLRGVDFTAALKAYIERYGENRYFYKRLPAVDSDISTIDQNTADTRALDLLTQKALYQMLYANDELAGDFKRRVLGWYDSDDTAGADVNAGSPYAPELIDNTLHNMPGLTGAVKNKLTDLLNSRRQSVQQTLNQQLWESGTILAVDDAGLQERISIVRRMLNEISSADLSEATHIAYISYRNRGITRIQQNIDFDKYDRIKKWVSGETPLADDMNYIFPRIKHVDDMLQPLRNDFGNSWNIPGMVEYPDGNPDKLTHIKFYGPFVELLGKVLEHLTGNVSPQIQERLGEINSQISKTIRTLNRISWCMDMVDYNVVTDGAINLLAETLKNNCTPRMMLTDQFTPMVLEDSVGAYRETPRQAYIFRPLPDSRLHNYSQYLPEVGLISEYSMQVKHQRFGYGKHLYSQSLFPGEEVTIEMSTKSKREIEVTTNSSEKVFEDATSETSTDFNQELNNEFSKTTDKSNKDSFSASATLSASYLGASVSGSVSTSSESSNQVNEFAKGMENTTDKLATKLSDQRQVTFEQSTTSKETLSEENEQKTTRKFVNINKERTLTFNFFQITREYLNTLYLDDISFYYTSGKYRIAAIFVPIGFDPDKLTDAPDNEGYQQLKSVLTSLAGEGETWDSLVDRKVVRRIPGEVADAFPQNALAILFHPPYHEIMPLAVTNAFIASTFDKEENAVFDINHSIWRFLGNGTVSPEGLGISAFPKPEGELKQWPETEGAPSPYTTIFRSDKKVVADRIKVIGVAKKPYEYNLANIDICYSKVRHFRARYVDEGARNTLPLPVFRKTYVINTEGVYCENMLGQCGALEQFATDHRRLDVDAKRIANEQARLMTPPDIQHYTDSDGNTDFGLYGKAVEQYERIVKANRPEAVPATTPTGTESSN